MARIPLINPADASPEVRAEWDRIVAEHGVVTNMKATLLHSVPALHAVLEWYSLFARVKPFLGQRLAILFCDAISRENACELCATFMRRAIVQNGEDPQKLELDDREQAVVDFGRQLARDPNRVREGLYQRLEAHFTQEQIVELTVFGALMIVNNVVNSALQVDVDASLESFRVQPEVLFS